MIPDLRKIFEENRIALANACHKGLWLITGTLMLRWLYRRIDDPDLWWHLANGRYMAENRVFLRNDIFSHTLPGAEWINFEWLSQLILYGAYRLAGFPALQILTFLVGIASIVLFIMALREAGARGPLLWILTWIGYHVLKYRLSLRIEMITFCFLLGMLNLILKSRKDPDRYYKWMPWIAFAGTVVWCNLHGGYIFGFAVLFLLLVGSRLSGENPKFIAILDRMFTFALLGGLINPVGPKLVEIFLVHWMDFSSGPIIISEWQPVNFGRRPYFLVSLIIVSIVILFSLFHNRKQLMFWIMPALLFGYFGLKHERNLAFLPIIAFPLMTGTLVRKNSVFVLNENRLLGWALCLSMLTLGRPEFLKYGPMGLVANQSIPEAACAFVRNENIQGKMFNSYNFGGYVTWSLGPERKNFMDGRYIFYPILSDTEQIGTTEYASPSLFESYRRFLDSYDVTYAIVEYDGTVLLTSKGKQGFNLSIQDVMFPQSQWALVFWDDVSLVFLKRTGNNEKIISSKEYRHVLPYNKARMEFNIRNGLSSGENIRKELMRHKREVVESRRRDRTFELINKPTL